MKSLIYRHTKFDKGVEVTTIYIVGVPVFKRVIIDAEDTAHRPCGFTVFASDAPVADDDYDDTDEQ